MTDNGERKQERLEEVPLETTAREVQEHAEPAEPDEIVAGNPAAAEAVTTSLQLEGLPEPDNGSKSIVEVLLLIANFALR